MMMLLAPAPLSDLPAEALLARLRYRRAAIDPGNATGQTVDAGVMLSWLLPRLDRRLRQTLTPYLEVAAMRVFIIALRHRLAGVPPPPALLGQPWLAAGLLPLVEAPGEAGAVVARIEGTLSDNYPFARGLVGAFLDQGPGGVESRLMSGMLVQALAATRNPLVTMMLRFEIDRRNLLAVLRHRRWQLRRPPPLLAGGEVPANLLARVWASGDRAPFSRLPARLGVTGALELEPRAAERQLLATLGRRLQRAGRDPLGIGVVLDWLWRGEMAARSRALRQGGAADDNGLLDEVLP